MIGVTNAGEDSDYFFQEDMGVSESSSKFDIAGEDDNKAGELLAVILVHISFQLRQLADLLPDIGLPSCL